MELLLGRSLDSHPTEFGFNTVILVRSKKSEIKINK